MMAHDHPARQFVPFLKDLAEGRIAREGWLAWWDANAPELERNLLPGWLLKVRPRPNRSANESMAGAVAAASYILTALDIDHTIENRYLIAAQSEHEVRMAAIEGRPEQRARKFLPRIDAIKASYPKFGQLLQRRAELIVELDPGATEDEIKIREQSLDTQLPDALKKLLRACRHVHLEHFHIDLYCIFYHASRSGIHGPSDGMLCFADYFLEADGDQVLLDPRELPCDDPPVYYYAHEGPEVRPLAKSFSYWLESLGSSPLFRDEP